MRQVDQRVSVRCELTPLDAAGVAGYVHHRLGVAGRGESRVAFTPAALDAIHAGSSGVPRLINRICDRALQRAFVARTMHVDAEFIWRAVDDLGLDTGITLQDRALDSKPAQPPAPCPEPKLPAPVPVAALPIQSPAIEVGTPAEPVLSALAGFNSEDDASSSAGASIERSGSRYGGLTAAAAALLVAASIGVPAWYSRVRVDGQDPVAMLPPRPALTLSQSAVLPPPVDASLLPPLEPEAPMPVFATAVTV
jgi:hypothetical protein